MSETTGKKSTAYKNRYNQQNYDSLRIVVPAGQKATVEAFAREHGDSINGVTNKALLAYMGLETWPDPAAKPLEADMDAAITENLPALQELAK